MVKIVVEISLLTLVIAMLLLAATINLVIADRDDKPHKGNFGKCKTFGDREGCKETFTGKGHNDPEPLP